MYRWALFVDDHCHLFCVTLCGSGSSSLLMAGPVMLATAHSCVVWLEMLTALGFFGRFLCQHLNSRGLLKSACSELLCQGVVWLYLRQEAFVSVLISSINM